MLRLVRLPAFRNAYLLRGFAVWVGLRLALAVAGAPHPGPVERGAVLGLVALAVFLDVRRRGEALFLGNLGIPAEAAPAVGVGIPLLLELLLP